MKKLLAYEYAEDGLVLLEDLEFEYCLPRGFWTANEWSVYTKRKGDYKAMVRNYNQYRCLCLRYDEENNNGE